MLITHGNVNKLFIFFVLIIFITSCTYDDDKLEAVSSALKYLSKEDPHFSKYFTDTIYINTFSSGFTNNPGGTYNVLGSGCVINSKTIVFKDLPQMPIKQHNLKNVFDRYTDTSVIIFLTTEKALLDIIGKKNSLKDKKWLFTVGDLRGNEHFSVFYLYYQNTMKSYLGCEFLFDHHMKEFIKKQCELPFKEPKN